APGRGPGRRRAGARAPGARRRARAAVHGPGPEPALGLGRAARRAPAEGAADPAHRPAGAARDAAALVPRADHPQRGLLRALAPRRAPDVSRPLDLAPARRGPRRAPADPVAGRPPGPR